MARARILLAALAGGGLLLWVAAVVASRSAANPDWKHALPAELGLFAVVAAAALASGWRPDRSRLRRPALRRPSAPALAAAGAGFVFLAITVWWLSQNGWIPNGDAARHLVMTHSYMDAIAAGNPHLLVTSPPVIDKEFYPPFAHLVGSLGSLVAGFGINTAVMAENLVFVPMLVVGCYGIASHVYDRRAGVLAVVFVLGAPILVAQFHVFMLDAPLAGLLAMTVWLLLRSEGFSKPGIATLAGLAAGLGTMTKITFPLFVAGVVLVMLARGGWRNPKGFVLFAGVALLVSQPWILYNQVLLEARTDRATAGPTSARATGALGNWGAYFWAAVNVQLLLPLFLAFLAGVAHTVVTAARRRAPEGSLELLGGVVVGVIAVANMSYFNERYDMPLLPYAAVLGVGWIVLQPRRVVRRALSGAVVVVAAVNLAMASFGWGGPVRLWSGDRYVTFVSDTGYVEAAPIPSPGVLEMLRRAHAEGTRKVLFQPESLNTGGFNLNGLAVWAYMSDLEIPYATDAGALGPQDLYLTRARLVATSPEPCIRLEAPGLPDEGIYVYRGGPPAPARLYCPGRSG